MIAWITRIWTDGQRYLYVSSVCLTGPSKEATSAMSAWFLIPATGTWARSSIARSLSVIVGSGRPGPVGTRVITGQAFPP